MAAPGDWEGMEGVLRSLEPAHWRVVVDHAVQLGFAGLFARNLAWTESSLGVSVPVVERLATLRRGQLVQQLNRKAAARRVADAFDGAGIPFVAFKGVALAEEVYGDLSLRSFRDFDVLVPHERIDQAYGVLLDMGYRMPHFGHVRDWVRHGAHAVGMAHPDGNGVDLHWSVAPDLLDAERIAVVWNACRPAAPGSHLPGLRLSPEMTLIHLAKHFHSHQYRALKPLVDFYVAARRLGAEVDSDALVATTRSLRLLPVVEIAIRLCERSFIPGSLPRLLGNRPAGIQARLAAIVVTDRFMLNSAQLPRVTNWLRFLLAAGGAGAAFRNVIDLLVPSKLLLTQFFNRPFDARMYPAYYWRQLRKVVTLSTKWT